MKSNGKLKQRFTFSDLERVEQIFSQYPDKKSAHPTTATFGAVTGGIHF